MSADRSPSKGEGPMPRGWQALSSTPVSLRALLIGSAIGDFGNGFFRLALPWLVYNLTGSAAALGAMVALSYVPTLFLPFIGRLTDRMSVRRMLLASLVVQFATLAALAILLHQHRLSLYAADAGAFLATGGAIGATAATEVTIQRLTPAPARIAINGLWWMLFNISWYVSPALAGFAIGRFGVGGALVVNAVAVAGMMGPVFLLPRMDPVAPLPAVRGRASLGEPLVALRQARDVFAATVVFGYWTFTWAAVFALQVFLFRHRLHLAAPMVGVVGLVAGIAPVILALTAPYILPRIRVVWLLSMALWVSGTGMVVLALAHNWWTATIAVGLIDAVTAPVGIVVSTLAQRAIPARLFGQVVGWQAVIQSGGTPVASLLAGIAAVAFGAGGAMLAAATLTLCGGLLLPLSPWRRVLEQKPPLR